MKILCLDQAIKITGYSVWKDKELDTYGLLEVDPYEKNYVERMKLMSDKIADLIKEVKPDFIVFEDTQFQNNYKTYQQLSQFQGVIMCYLFQINIGFCICKATEWKKVCGIKGRKREEQKLNTIMFVKDKYNIDASEDICDAIGIGTWAMNNIKQMGE